MTKQMVTMTHRQAQEPVEVLPDQVATMERRGWVTVAQGAAPVDVREERIRRAIAGMLNVTSPADAAALFTADGLPRVDEIEARAGIADVTAGERDRIFADMNEGN